MGLIRFGHGVHHSKNILWRFPNKFADIFSQRNTSLKYAKGENLTESENQLTGKTVPKLLMLLLKYFQILFENFVNRGAYQWSAKCGVRWAFDAVDKVSAVEMRTR